MDGDRECSEREPGAIQLRSDCLFSGYWGADGFQESSLHDGWYDTGDYGFQVGEDTFVIGRMKDIVIVGGQNVFPEDVETVVNTQTGIYPGRVVAFGVEDTQYGTQALAIVAEMQGLYAPQIADSLAQQIRALVLSAIGIAARHVAVVPERWIVKSTAGKISRRDTRRRFLEHFRTESQQPQTQTEEQVLGQPERSVRA
jgi:acyl-CoA synthetase (AMP-forming)/AMP-acid ligase II